MGWQWVDPAQAFCPSPPFTYARLIFQALSLLDPSADVLCVRRSQEIRCVRGGEEGEAGVLKSTVASNSPLIQTRFRITGFGSAYPFLVTAENFLSSTRKIFRRFSPT